jgi:hypothetical protein
MHMAIADHDQALVYKPTNELWLQVRGVPAYIVVPNNTPRCKVAAVGAYGGV